MQFDGAIAEFKRFVKNGWDRGIAIKQVAQNFGISASELASEMARRAAASRKRRQQAVPVQVFPKRKNWAENYY
jgi:hypothetical protein